MQPYRSLLFVPAHKADWVHKALRAEPDAIILDLEDAVPADAKARARDGLDDAITEARATAPHVGLLVRPNHWSTSEGPADLEAAVRARADALLVPKVDRADDLVHLGAILDYLERTHGVPDGATEVVASLESAAGLVATESIVRVPRVAGALAAAARDGDTARSVGFTWTPAGLETLAFRSHAVLACRAADARHPIVGLWQDVQDLDGLRDFAVANQQLGFRGQVVIHPSHVATVNEVYSPSPATVAYYRGLVEAWDAAQQQGAGAVVYDGDHIDVAHVATARDVLAFAERLAARG